MTENLAYIGLGGNARDTISLLIRALEHFVACPSIKDLRCSSFYQTSPVGPIEQDDYINAVCSFKTTFEVLELYQFLEEVESSLGKIKKAKFAPRPIDLDLLLFGTDLFDNGTLQVPHSAWDQRLFVLVPMRELTPSVVVPIDGELVSVDLEKKIAHFDNIHNERVTPLNFSEMR